MPQYNINADYARKTLEANKHNNITATYYLLVKKYVLQGRRGITNPNSSLEARTLSASMRQMEQDKKLGDSMRVECRKSSKNADSFMSEQKDGKSALAYFNAGIKSEKKKNMIFDNAPVETDPVYYKKRSEFSHYKNGMHRLPEDDAAAPQRRAQNNRRNTSYRDRKPESNSTHNKTAINYAEDIKGTHPGDPDWSFEVVTENTGNAKLQKMYDLYHPPTIVHNGITDYAAAFKKLHKKPNLQPIKAFDEDRDRSCLVPQPPPVAPVRKNHRTEAAQGKRGVAKSTSPHNNVRAETESRTATRSKPPKRDETAKTEADYKLTTSGAENGSSPTRPITIIQTPQINNINNYNNIRINTISIGPVPPATVPIPPPPPAAGPRTNNFRRRKYKLSETEVPELEEHKAK